MGPNWASKRIGRMEVL
uniref:Uncharacterized protein n=1 Tax=Anguilla anguilla TaxID=7936 RepID=A0A0E9RRS5_ANGAN